MLQYRDLNPGLAVRRAQLYLEQHLRSLHLKWRARLCTAAVQSQISQTSLRGPIVWAPLAASVQTSRVNKLSI